MFKIILYVVLVFGINTVAYAQEPRMVSTDQDKKAQISGDYTQGAEISNLNCSRYHPSGGNTMVPNMALTAPANYPILRLFSLLSVIQKCPTGLKV